MSFFRILIFLLLPVFTYAQTLDVRHTLVEYDEQDRFALAVNFEAPPKAVKEAWTDFLKSELDLKLKGFGFLTNKDLLKAEKVSVPELSDKELNFYTLFNEEEERTIMNVFASFGYDIFINQQDHPKAYSALRGLVNSFVRGYVPAFYEEKIEETAEVVEDLEEEVADLNKSINKNKADIEDNKKEIEELQEENEEKSASLEEKKQMLEQRKALLSEQRSKLKSVEADLDGS